jgi:cytochrome c oxidase subunit 3
MAESGTHERERAAAEARLTGHFADLGQQKHAALLGMWIFIASEVLFFGVLFTLYASYRATYPEAFAEAAKHTDMALGVIMTYVLLTASFLVAAAMHTVRADRKGATALLFLAAAGLAVLFLGLKGWEWYRHFQEGLFPGRYYAFEELEGPGPMAFYMLYYFMTGLHFIHVAVGVVLLAAIGWRARSAYNRYYHTPVEVGGMYWHFVDIVWLFLWPIFYLMRA